MAGLKRIAKLCGGIIVGNTEYVYDYAIDDLVLKSEMTKERKAESEQAKWMKIKEQLKNE